ncbi:MAG: hypothetical protein H7336_16425 [Bacteriovorax sp.]|nr:hypothetical protein [Bacteriovorax sp.]
MNVYKYIYRNPVEVSLTVNAEVFKNDLIHKDLLTDGQYGSGILGSFADPNDSLKMISFDPNSSCAHGGPIELNESWFKN